MSDTITQDGRTYSLADLAYYLDDEHREELHSDPITPCPAQVWWDEYARRWPGDAAHAIACAPEQSKIADAAELEG